MTPKESKGNLTRKALITSISSLLSAESLVEDRVLVNFAMFEEILGFVSEDRLQNLFGRLLPTDAPGYDDPVFSGWLSGKLAELPGTNAAIARAASMLPGDLSNIAAGRVKIGRKRWERLVSAIQEFENAPASGRP
jgi:hypothetical protein